MFPPTAATYHCEHIELCQSVVTLQVNPVPCPQRWHEKVSNIQQKPLNIARNLLVNTHILLDFAGQMITHANRLSALWIVFKGND